ncbi:uncharacterized protein [Eurosta solidaginis]|uniref:uncharacterized protein isoform X1 n=1 Tax=Eurosta solidaginis TaxID=178769 RepID=UPI0035317894
MWKSSSIWWFFTALLCLISSGHREQVVAWQARGNYHNEAYPGKCVYNCDTIISPLDTVKSPDTCAEIHCDNEYGDVTISGCGTVSPPEGCEWDGYVDEQAAYPACCAQNLKCEGGMNNQTRQALQEIWSMLSPDLKVRSIVDSGSNTKF